MSTRLGLGGDRPGMWTPTILQLTVAGAATAGAAAAKPARASESRAGTALKSIVVRDNGTTAVGGGRLFM